MMLVRRGWLSWMRAVSPVVLVPLIAVGLGGCLLVPRKHIGPGETEAAMVAPAASAVLVIYPAIGSSGSTDVIDEANQCLAFTSHSDAFITPVAPGRHQVIALGGAGQSSGITVELAAGKTYFLAVTPDPANKKQRKLVPIKPKTKLWANLDDRLRQLSFFRVVQSKCADHLSAVRPGWTNLIEKTKATVEGLAPSLTPEDGVVWQDSASKSR